MPVPRFAKSSHAIHPTRGTLLLGILLTFACGRIIITRADSTLPAVKSTQIKFNSGDGWRTAVVHVPAQYSRAEAVPLILNLHGRSYTGSGQESLSGMSDLADREGFLVAYPDGLDNQWITGPGSAAEGDLAFLRDLVAMLKSEYAIDPKRIYITGISNGGGMANRAACDLADMVAAIAPVAGAYNYWTDCHPSRPVPVMAFHGLSDTVVPYDGVGAGDMLPPIPEWAAAWAERNACQASPKETHPNAAVTRREWSGCSGGATVILFAIAGHGHSWPGSNLLPAITSKVIDANQEMWEFFQAHPMP